MKPTGAAILVSRGMKVLQAAPAAYPYRSAASVTDDSSIAMKHLRTIFLFIACCTLGCTSSNHDELAKTRNKLALTEQKLLEKEAELRKAKADTDACVRAVESISKRVGQQRAEGTATKVATLVGFGAQTGSGFMAIAAHAQKCVYGVWCGPVEFP